MLEAAFERKQWWRPLWYSTIITLAAIGTIISAIVWVQAYASERAYDRYHGCMPVSCDTPDISEATATVLDADRTYGKNPSYWIDIGGWAGSERITLADGAGVWRLVAPEDTVIIDYWRSLPTAVQFGNVVSQTDANPDVNAAKDFAAMIFFASVFGFLAALGWIRGRPEHASSFTAIGFWILLTGSAYAIWVTVARQTVFYPLPLSCAGAGLLILLVAAAGTALRRARTARTAASQSAATASQDPSYWPIRRR